MRKEGGFFVDLKAKAGLAAAQKGLQVMTLGRTILNLKKNLPKGKKKAAKQAAKAALRAERKQFRKGRNRRAVKKGKGIGRVALAIRNRYF